jgi:hypothetical protein
MRVVEEMRWTDAVVLQEWVLYRERFGRRGEVEVMRRRRSWEFCWKAQQ